MWRDYFLDNPETEEMYQAFKDRMYAEAEGETFDHWKERELRDEKDRHEAQEEHYNKYLRNEHYRAMWAQKQGYTFKPKEYNPQEKYR